MAKPKRRVVSRRPNRSAALAKMWQLVAGADQSHVKVDDYHNFILPVYSAIENVKAGRTDEETFWRVYEAVTYANCLCARLMQFAADDNSNTQLAQCEAPLVAANEVVVAVAKRFANGDGWRFGGGEVSTIVDAVELCDVLTGIASEGHVVHSLLETMRLRKEAGGGYG